MQVNKEELNHYKKGADANDNALLSILEELFLTKENWPLHHCILILQSNIKELDVSAIEMIEQVLAVGIHRGSFVLDSNDTQHMDFTEIPKYINTLKEHENIPLLEFYRGCNYLCIDTLNEKHTVILKIATDGMSLKIVFDKTYTATLNYLQGVAYNDNDWLAGLSNEKQELSLAEYDPDTETAADEGWIFRCVEID